MKQVYLNELRANDTVQSEYFGVSDIHKGTDKTGKPYWDLTLVDNSASLKAKIWSDVLMKLGSSTFQNFDSGSIISCSGNVQEFRGVLQLVISELAIVDPKQAGLEVAEIFPSSKIPETELRARLEKIIASIKDPFLLKLVTTFYKEWQEQILIAPAAKVNHHNFRGGLAEHLLEMFHIAETIANDYQEANLDIIKAGIFFHDIGKLQELEFSNFAISYSLKGKLLGHISIGSLLLQDSLQKNFPKLSAPEELLYIQVQHIILSHHYQLEWGSPVTPKSIEAVIVSKIDDLSSKAQLFRRINLEYQNSDVDFTPYINGANGEVFLNKTAIKETTSGNELKSKKISADQPQII